MVYNFICTLKGIDFKYKVEANNITEAKVKVRDHIKNSIHIEEVIKKPTNQKSSDLLNVFEELLKNK